MSSSSFSSPYPPRLLFLLLGLAIVVGMVIGQFGWPVVALGVGIILLLFLADHPRFLILLALLLLLGGQFGRLAIGGGTADLLLLDGVMAGLFIVWGAIFLFHSRKFSLASLPPVGMAWLAFLLVAFISLLFPPLVLSKRDILLDSFYWWRLLFYSSLTWSIPVFFPRQTEQWRLIRWVLWVSAGVMLLGFLQLYILPDIRIFYRFGWDPHVGRLVSTFLDPNYLAGFLAFALAAWAALLMRFPKTPSLTLPLPVRKLLPWAWVMIILFLLATVLTYSRSGYLAVGVLVIILGLYYSPKLLLIAALCFIPLFLTVPRIKERLSGAVVIDTTAQDRLDSWVRALEVGQLNPITGVGYNHYRAAQEELGLLKNSSQTRAGAGSDSSLLTVLATTGGLGVGLFFTTLFFLLGDLWKAWRSPKNALAYYTASVLLFLALPLAVHSLFVNSLFFPFLLLPLGLFIGCFYAAQAERPPSPPL